MVCGLHGELDDEEGGSLDSTHGKKYREEFWSEQRVIWSPKFGGTGYETLVVDSQLLGDFWTGHNFAENVFPRLTGDLRFEISFGLGKGYVSKDKSNDLAFDKIEVDRCRETKMALFCQIQRLYVDHRSGNTVDYALGDVPEVEGEFFRDEKGLIVRWSVVETAGNGMVWENVGVVFITSIIECRSDLDFEGEDTSDYLND